jgi:predicted transcriptional regulator
MSLRVIYGSSKFDHLHLGISLSKGATHMQPAIDIKEEIHRLADQLSDQATWDDVAREVAFRKAVQEGLADAETGRVSTVIDVKRKWEAKLAAQLDL